MWLCDLRTLHIIYLLESLTDYFPTFPAVNRINYLNQHIEWWEFFVCKIPKVFCPVVNRSAHRQPWSLVVLWMAVYGVTEPGVKFTIFLLLALFYTWMSLKWSTSLLRVACRHKMTKSSTGSNSQGQNKMNSLMIYACNYLFCICGMATRNLHARRKM